ncbi:hypothetical protein N0V94_005432, partial [Neodidymelliopsis sp. IMI 364377]
MDYIGNRVRQLGGLFTSSSPASSTLGKRKARDGGDSDEEDTPSSRKNAVRFAEGYVTAEYLSPPRTGSLDLDEVDGYVSTAESDDDDDGDDSDDLVIQRPQRRIRNPAMSGARSQQPAVGSRASTVTKRAEEVMLRAREIMQKDERGRRDNFTPKVQTGEERIQKDLDREQREDEADQKALRERRKKMRKVVSELQDNHQPSKLKTGPQASDHVSSSPQQPHTTSTESKEKWSNKPNRRAREILETNPSSTALLRDLQEPAYVCRDTEIRDGVWKMMSQMEDLVNKHFDFEISHATRLRSTFESLAPETVKIIGCVASGGPAGASGWEDLFLIKEKRKALVCAIVGNVLVQQVFEHIFIGGTEAQIREVAGIQETHREKDGFERNTLYATTIRSFLSQEGESPLSQLITDLNLPSNFADHTNHITAAIWTHISPIYYLHHNRSPFIPPPLFNTLHSLTVHAALLSLHMRIDGHTVYHFTPAFKDQPFTRTNMECFNESAMISTHPQGSGDKDMISKPEQERRKTLDAKELQRMKRDQALVQISLLPGMTAYRRGG